MLITVLLAFFNIITYLLFNSDHGMGCVYSPPGLVIFVAVEGTFVHFTKRHDHFISNYIVAAAYAKTKALSRAYRNALAILAVATLRGGNELCLLIYAVRVCRLPSLFSRMFLDTLYSKKWYDMPHIGCGIHSLQRSTICRIGSHSAVYNIGMRVVFYKL